MKKLLFFICCIFCICILIYMCYKAWLGFSWNNFTFDYFVDLAATAGWGIITFKVVTREYSWAASLCK